MIKRNCMKLGNSELYSLVKYVPLSVVSSRRQAAAFRHIRIPLSVEENVYTKAKVNEIRSK